MTAIVAGTVVTVAVTLASLWLSADEASAPPAETAETERHAFVDPRGPERGPDALEWDVVRAYKPIESMTAAEPGDAIVDRALAELRAYANEHTDDPYVQELYLKGLRVAMYHAAEAGVVIRAAALEARFHEHAARFGDYEGVLLESMRLAQQKLR
jgi:hypothetical protein